MFEAKEAERVTPLEERRMWRLLLARLHPDAGGDQDLFAFACAVRDEVSGGAQAGVAGTSDGVRVASNPAPHFLRAWQDAMGDWSSTNRDALKNLRTG